MIFFHIAFCFVSERRDLYNPTPQRPTWAIAPAAWWETGSSAARHRREAIAEKEKRLSMLVKMFLSFRTGFAANRSFRQRRKPLAAKGVRRPGGIQGRTRNDSCTQPAFMQTLGHSDSSFSSPAASQPASHVHRANRADLAAIVRPQVTISFGSGQGTAFYHRMVADDCRIDASMPTKDLAANHQSPAFGAPVACRKKGP
jgi:hypothetical protein